MTIFFCNFAVEFEKRPENSREVAQLVAHYVRDVGVGRSSRLFPTKKEPLWLFFLFIEERGVLSQRIYFYFIIILLYIFGII